ncbi:hypothetical protein [Paenibacillus sp. FSL H7-0331]|uniref:hypothetical protein n=2 Tax=Paenibacillus sp. FSL H7-0331 TaxID=1920421 RepID=UPI0015C2E02E|nr:hypothetical protein [Paenibacillus sp. FSL H7-0331]
MGILKGVKNMADVLYRYKRSGRNEEIKIASLERAMSLAALNLRENIDPVEIIVSGVIYDFDKIKQYIKVNNVL